MGLLGYMQAAVELLSAAKPLIALPSRNKQLKIMINSKQLYDHSLRSELDLLCYATILIAIADDEHGHTIIIMTHVNTSVQGQLHDN